MAIRFVQTPEDGLRRSAKGSEHPGPIDATPDQPSKAQAEGEARFATPIEAPAPVNPDPAGELPFSDLPRAEKAARKARAPRSGRPGTPDEPGRA